MADEMRNIVPVGGSYAGQPISVPAKEAEKLLKGGYARDPYQPFAEVPERPDDVDEVLAAAEKRWRGEEEAKPKSAEPKGKAEEKSAEAGEAGTYETRDMAAPDKRPRGRPPGR